jgi:hypothetical protein
MWVSIDKYGHCCCPWLLAKFVCGGSSKDGNEGWTLHRDARLRKASSAHTTIAPIFLFRRISMSHPIDVTIQIARVYTQ